MAGAGDKFDKLMALKTKAGEGGATNDAAQAPAKSTPEAAPKPSAATTEADAVAKPPEAAKPAPASDVKSPSLEKRFNIAIKPSSKVFRALEESRAELPPPFQTQTLSSLLLKFLDANDAKLAKDVKRFLTDS